MNVSSPRREKYLCVSIQSLVARKGAAVSDGDMPRQQYIRSELRKAHCLHHAALFSPSSGGKSGRD